MLFYVSLLHLQPEGAVGAVVFFLLCAIAMGAARCVSRHQVTGRYSAWAYCDVLGFVGVTEPLIRLMCIYGGLSYSLPFLWSLRCHSSVFLSYNVDMGFLVRLGIAIPSPIIQESLFALFTTKLRITHPIFVWLGAISYSVYLLGP